MGDSGAGGILYGVGVGPGDPELLTFKAARIIKSADVIAVPVAKEGEESFALKVVRDVLRPEQPVLHLLFPMTTDADEREVCVSQAYVRISALIEEGKNVAFLAEGDPLLHSTFIYLLEKCPPAQEVEIVPGISAVMASAAGAHYPLVRSDGSLAVLPAAFLSREELRRALESADTLVLMKVYRVLDDVIGLLEEMDLLEGAVLVGRASLEDQTIEWNVRSLRGKRVPYFSTLLVRGRKESVR